MELARLLEKGASERAHSRLQALAAWCYGITVRDFEHVLTTFPLVPESERTDTLRDFTTLVGISASA